VGTAGRLLEFARWCRENQVAVLQTCDVYSNIFGLPAGALASVPVRIGSRRGFVESRGLTRLQRGAYSAAHRVVANSSAAARADVPADKVVVIRNGIDVQLFAPREYHRKLRRIALVACLREEKRIDLLIKAAPRVLARHPDVEFVIAGDGSCRESLQTLARELGVAERLSFLGHRDDVPAVLATADIFAFPSRSDAFPNSIIEAMASGLPVVATAVGGIPELVDDGRTGVLVPSGDADALVRALIELLDQPERAAAFGRAGRQRIEQTYSFDRMVQQFEALYLSELAARTGRVPLKEAV
jgi:glycosyltransferase involved in cell wall biosynthesis